VSAIAGSDSPGAGAVRPGGSAPDLLDPAERSFLDRAVRLGREGWGRVHPNPMVGCVLVKEGEVVGEGWHAEYGGAHAEVAALHRAGERAHGAHAYVSLEPCRHQGKTPPCTDALVEAGVARVVFGASDPGAAAGGGARALLARGVEVVGPVFPDAEAHWENPVFFHSDPNRPWLALKLAISIDGRISTGGTERTLLSGERSFEEVHRLRAGFDALLVGTRTVLLDDPLLTVRGPLQPRTPPRRVLLDAAGRLGPDARMFREPGGEVWILTTPESPESWRRSLREVGARILEVPEAKGGGVDLQAALVTLRGEGISSLLCEGGGVLGSELLRGRFVDRLHLVWVPRFLGPGGVPAFPDPGPGRDASPDRSVPGSRGAPAGWRDWVPGEPPRGLGRDVWVALRPEAS